MADPLTCSEAAKPCGWGAGMIGEERGRVERHGTTHFTDSLNCSGTT